MKLRNKKTGRVGDFDIEHIKERGGFIRVKRNDVPYYQIKRECGTLYYYNSLTELNEEWEDVKPIESSKCYLINEKTGYIATFDSKSEMNIFMKEVDGWKPVKVLLDGEKYTIERLRGANK